METERYNSRLTPPSLPNSSRPLPALPCPCPPVACRQTLVREHCYKLQGQLLRSALSGRDDPLWQKARPPLNCVNLMSRQHFRIKPATRTVESGGSRPPAAQSIGVDDMRNTRRHSDCSANRSGRWFYKFQCTPWAPVACLAHKQ